MRWLRDLRARWGVDPAVAVPLFIAVGATIAAYAAVKLSSPFLYNDWTRVLLFRSGADAKWIEEEMVRPLPKIAYAFGSHPFPTALLYLGCEVLCFWLVVRLFSAVGFSRPASIMAAIIALLSRGSFVLLSFLGLSESTVGRCFTLGLILEMLRPVPRRSLWLALLAGGALSHELSIASAPLLLICAFYRGGLDDVKAGFRSRAWREFFAAWMLLWAVRAVLYSGATHSTHGVSLAGFSASVPFFLNECRRVLLPVLVIGSFALALRRLPTAGEMWRAVGFGFAWAVAGYGAFWAADSYRTSYFFNLSVVGLALIPATLIVSLLKDQGGHVAVRLVAAVMVFLSFVEAPEWPQRHDAALATLGDAVSARDVEVNRVIFFEDPSLTTHELPQIYRAVIADEYGENEMLKVKFPHKRFSSVAVPAALLPWYCPQPNDVAVLVSADPDDWFRIEPTSSCAPGSPPPAYANATDGSPAFRSFLDQGRRYWLGGRDDLSGLSAALGKLSDDERPAAESALAAIRLSRQPDTDAGSPDGPVRTSR